MLVTTSSSILILVLAQTAVSQKATSVCLDNGTETLTNNCLGCICEASTRCDVFTGCVANGALCGPFLISQGFWIDAGKCVMDGDDPNDIESFRKCTNDLKCASRIVRSHMAALGQDCNGDGVVTCDDYVMMHRNGGYTCNLPLDNTEYWKIYTECKARVSQQGENI